MPVDPAPDAGSESAPFGCRLAGPSDVEAATDTVTSAFGDDPVWALALGVAPVGRWAPGPSGPLGLPRSWWRLFVKGAVTHGWLWVTTGCEAVAVWLPPDCPELGPEEESRLEAIMSGLSGRHGTYLRAVLSLFEASRPKQPHFYLSLLGTHEDHRGAGIGMALLAHTLAEIDELGGSAYLESTNPINLGRYRSVGFEKLGEFALPGGHPVVTTMWRPPR